MSSTPAYPNIPDARPILGHMPEMQADTYAFYLRQHAAHGARLKFKAFPGMPFYSFTEPDAIHHVLIKSRQKYSRGRRWSHIVSFIGGKGIVTSKGELWREQRAKIQPFFQPRRIEAEMDTIVGNTRHMITQWQNMPKGASVNISQEMMRLGLINISDILFHYDIRPMADAFSTAMMDGFAYINRFIQDPLALPRFLPTAVNKKFRADKKIADDIVTEIIRTIRAKDDESMINALVKAGNSDRQLHDEIITLLMAGHDTVSTALAWAWYLLAKHPEVLQKAQEEIDSVLQGTPASAATLESLPYTKMIFKETLRLYPSAWALHRVVEEPDHIMGLPVQRFSSVVLPVYVTHRDAQYWEKPHAFHPEHFAKEAEDKRPRFAYIPFGGGERVCIGAGLANMEGTLILATLLQHFTPTLAEGGEINPVVNFTLKPARDITAILTPRTKTV
jgi:cytochrome P450